MVTVEDFSRLVAVIYAAAVAPQRWDGAIREIHRAIGGTNGALLVADRSNRSHLSSTLALEASKSYMEHYHRLDNELGAVEKGPVGAVRIRAELIGPNRNPEFYTDWMRPNEVEDALLVRLTGGPRSVTFVATSPRPSFATPERVKLISGLVVHLQQALRAQDKLTALADTTVEMAGALDAVRNAVIVVKSGSVVINLNAAAESIFRAEDGLGVRSGRITATSAHAEQALQHALYAALTDDGSTVRGGHSLTCARPSRKRPYVVHVLPLHCNRTDERFREAAALVLIIDPEHEPQPAAALLRRVYGLTNTEAQVALRIMRGADLKQISKELSISLTTVRTHLQHVFGKTDTHRQAELVRLLLVLCP
jgi:DNA-binding CsgD family transcriptional regulator